MLDRDAMHVENPDLCWTGGLTEGRKIAAMAETYHRPFAPHEHTRTTPHESTVQAPPPASPRPAAVAGEEGRAREHECVPVGTAWLRAMPGGGC